MPEQNKKLAGFEALYEVDRAKRQQQVEADEAETSITSEVTERDNQPPQESISVGNNVSKSVSNKVSNKVSNITSQASTDVFEPTTFKADRRKVRELKRLALELKPPRKLQELFDEALADVLTKYGRNTE